MDVLLFLLLLINPVPTAKILMTVPFGGSHLIAMCKMADILAGDNHDITLLTLVRDDGITDRLLPANVKVLSPGPDMWIEGQTSKVIASTIKRIVQSENTAIGDANLNQILPVISKYYFSEEMERILSENSFDLAIADVRAVSPLSLALYPFNTPIISFSPAINYFVPRLEQNLPSLLNSEPHFVTTSDGITAHSFWERYQTLYSLIEGYWAQSSLHDIWQNQTAKIGVTSVKEAELKLVQLYFVNDHYAFSFPFLAPQNVISIGGYSLQTPQPLPADIQEFIEMSGDIAIVYVSFGSYVSLEGIPWFQTILSVLKTLQLRVLLKRGKSDVLETNRNFLVKTWMPQIDLLASQRVSVFLSHCGNNGKLEATYHSTPLLCIPQYGDQLFNSKLVKYRGFGEVILKEDLTELKLKHLLEKMLAENEDYKARMRVAKNIVENEPFSGVDKIGYYVELLAKHKSLGFLRNEVILEQGLHQIYNLDIIIGGCFILTTLLLICFFVSYKFLLK